MATPPATTESITAMVERIVREFHPQQVILFGSHARGEARPDSDVDLLVVLPEVEDPGQAWSKIYEAVRGFHVSVDIVVTTPDEIARLGNLVGMVYRPALRDGKVLYDARGDGTLRASGAASGQRDVGEAPAVSEDLRLTETRRWLRYAREDLVATEALVGSRSAAPRHICFLAQQAAEKGLTAVLVFLQVQYPFTHDLNKIRDAIPAGWRVRVEHPALGDLTKWAVQGRYIGDWAEPTEADARGAVQQARGVLESVLDDLRSHGFDVEEQP